MSLKTRILIVRIIMVVVALVVIGVVIATFENPGKTKFLSVGVGTCGLLAVIHGSLVKEFKNKE